MDKYIANKINELQKKLKIYEKELEELDGKGNRRKRKKKRNQINFVLQELEALEKEHQGITILST